MALTNNERIAKGLDLLRDGLGPKCAQTWAGFYGEGWLDAVNQKLRSPARNPNPEDLAFLFNGVLATWNEVFGHGFPPAVRALVFEAREARNAWAHQGRFSSDDAGRALDSMERLLEAFGVLDQRQAVRDLRRDLLRQMFEAESRSEHRKIAARPTEGAPQAGLTPWRDIVVPHSDVRTGRFDQAEFAADLHAVAEGRADPEYQDPRAFFARTYLTQGLRDLLATAARRLSGQGGDPVIELQTNFGGGKTHSLIALYHLASGAPAGDLAGVGELLAEQSLSLPPKIARAVLVGQAISPSAPAPVGGGVRLHTLWGHLAYQLGGPDGYELVRRDDEAGTNPGAALRELFRRFGPAVVLIDEWVAYARQLRDDADDRSERLAGGDFDTQFTFAQALTEAAAAVPNAVVLVSIPSSVIEVGGPQGRTALDRLRNVVTRLAAQWQPAGPDESFEIVRRRLFDPMTADQARRRDGVVRAFADMYRRQPGDFPPEAAEPGYRRRMELSYPIHPELFDRLFGDWSALDKFQRTRGVLRLMALAVSQLWQRSDQSLLIMPGNLPMDSGTLASEMKKYLEEGWDPVIKSDVDGENALPLRIDNEFPHFGRLSAARRAARTVYAASAPRPDGGRGVDLKSVVLGCAQPGEPVGQFKDALRELSGRASHLYVDGAHYWYSLLPNATRVAADRANSDYSDHDADDEVSRRIADQADRGDFAAVHVFAEGPGDVSDDAGGVRLVVLAPGATHSPGDLTSPAVELAGHILAQRGGGPRANRNLVVFAAAAANRLEELRAAARLHLAWGSITAGRRALDLTAHQQRQAETKAAETSQQVDSLIAETFTQVLVPAQAPGSAEIEWHTVRAAGRGDLGARVSRKLVSEEKLITEYGGVRVRMDLDNFGLWSERGDISVGDLWNLYARHPYLPRLASFEVLAAAVSDGTAKMNWAAETFAYAAGRDGPDWRDLVTAEHVKPTPDGLIVHSDRVPTPPEAAAASRVDGIALPGGAGAGAGDSGRDSAPDPGPSPDPPAATEFYARFDLNPIRGIRQLGEILEHITARLGPDVRLELEVRAASAEGYDDATRRIVSENAVSLNAKAAEFE